jgi:4-hydroxybenzoate polyprenyltransferase
MRDSIRRSAILSRVYALVQNMRPKQWTKNGFVFAALIFDQKLLDGEAVWRVLVAFGLLCLMASTVYLVNDLVDLEKDRQHPKKKNRPLASGRLPLSWAITAAVILPLAALGIALLYSPALAGVLLAYLVLHIVYSFVLKEVVIIDVFSIAAGFILRVLAGVVVIEVEQFSPWLYVCAGLLALFLAVGKRRQELLTMGENATSTRKIFEHYNLKMLDDMLRLTMASVAIGYTLYATEAETVMVTQTEYMLLTVPFIYYGLFRYMYVIYVAEHGGDPTEVLFEDRPLQLGIVAWIVVVLTLLYLT